MASKAPAAGFAAAVAIRALLIGGLAFAGLLAVQRGLYASAVVLGGVILLLALDLARLARSAHRALAVFIEGLDAEGPQWPLAGRCGHLDLTGPMEKVRGRMAVRQARARAELDHMQGLLDSVGAALLVVEAQAAPNPANRAARRLLGERLAPAVLGDEASARLTALQPGSSEIVRLADGSARLASCSGFMAPDETPRRLIALQKLAGELDAVQLKAWQDLVRVLSHELMNSLTAICSLAEASAGRLEGQGEVAEAMEVIARRSERLMDFVGRYRQVADLPAPRLEPIEGRAFAAGMEALTGAAIRADGLAYDSGVEPPDLSFAADRGLIEQAVINLLKNAREAVAGQEGGRLSLHVAAEAGGVVIGVADNGPGLSSQAEESLFVPFFTTKPGGSGIGLNLARQIAQAHGGRLDHIGGEGTRFRLWIPQNASPPPSGAVAPRGEGGHV